MKYTFVELDMVLDRQRNMNRKEIQAMFDTKPRLLTLKSLLRYQNIHVCYTISH